MLHQYSSRIIILHGLARNFDQTKRMLYKYLEGFAAVIMWISRIECSEVLHRSLGHLFKAFLLRRLWVENVSQSYCSSLINAANYCRLSGLADHN